ncbi:MAG: extracellular solute-binding protein [Eubacteriales bacterium]|nr:extracellular solute-binding protein [Eubacteriales bacterium]
MKKWLSVLLCCLLCLSLAPLSIAEQMAELQLWVPGSDNPLFEGYEAVSKAYTASHPNVTVNVTMIAWDEYFTKLSASFVGGEAPDVYGLGFLQFYTFLTNGYMLPLNEYISADWDGYDDIVENILEIGSADGNTYAFLVPEARSIYYRKDIAQENGVTEEDMDIQTLDDFIAFVKKMTIREGDETIVAGFDLSTIVGTSPEQNLFNLARMAGAPLMWKEDLSPNFDDPAYIATLTALTDLVNDGTCLLQTQGVNYFNTDVAAVTISNQSSIENTSLSMIEGVGGEIGIIPLPNQCNILLGQWYAANVNSAHPSDAADFLLYLNSTEAESMLLEKCNLVPNRKSLADDYCSGNELRTVYFNSLMNDAVSYGPVANGYFLSWANLYRSAIEAVYAGTATAQTSLETFCAEYKEVCGLN